MTPIVLTRPMEPGDMVRVHVSGKCSGDEVIDGLVLRVMHVDVGAKRRCDNLSRWIHCRMLVDGRERFIDLYWDDDVELLSEK